VPSYGENTVAEHTFALISVEAVQRIIDVTAGNIAAFLAGHPVNLVTVPARR
jgi:hypothetical protein